MANLNKVLLIGNLTRNPELKYTPSGSAVCDFGIATNRTYTSNNEKKEEVCFVDISVWGKQAESCSQYLQKGSPVFIEGRLKLDQWLDKDTQKQRSRLTVVAERVQFLSSKDGQNFQAPQQPQGQQPYNPDAMSADYGNPPHPQAESDYQKTLDFQKQHASGQPPQQMPPQQPNFTDRNGNPDDVPFDF